MVGHIVSFSVRLLGLWKVWGAVCESQAQTVVCATVERRSSRKEPPIFSGKLLELAEWIFAVEEALPYIPSDEQVAFAISYLAGDARRWLLTYLAENERPKNWTTLKESLETAFAPRSEKRHYVGHLLNARQEGTLEEYIERFRRLCLYAGSEVSEVTRTLIFVEGLNEALRRHVKLAQLLVPPVDARPSLLAVGVWGLPAISGKVTKTTTVVAPSLSLKLIPPTSSRVARCLSDGL